MIWYDGVDSDCDGASDYDADGDGFDWELYGGLDCDDTDPNINPNGIEIPQDGIDQNCDDAPEFDDDGDGVDGVEDGGTDCDDTDQYLPNEPEIWYDGSTKTVTAGAIMMPIMAAMTLMRGVERIATIKSQPPIQGH